MKMKKYIVENCSSIAVDNKNNAFCFNVNLYNKEQKLCKDCTDCVMKQIVNFCKMDVGRKDNMLLISRYALADLILELLEIEEVNEK